MRSICEIIADAKEGKIPTHEECYWTMLALSSMRHFSNRTLESLAESMDKNKNLILSCGIHLKSQEYLYDLHFKQVKSDPKEWLGAAGNPFSEENKKWRDLGRTIIKNATGTDV